MAGTGNPKDVWWVLRGTPVMSGDLHWQLSTLRERGLEGSGLRINFSRYMEDNPKECLKWLADKLTNVGVTWLSPAGNPQGRWILDFDAVKAFIGNSEIDADLSAFTGRVFVRPHYEFKLDIKGRIVGKFGPSDEASARFDYPPLDDDEGGWEMTVPGELQPYLEKFRMDHPNPMKAGFVMMRFTDTSLQRQAYEAVKNTCSKLGLAALRADEKSYADELWPNIRTYMHGCGFGVAIFERIVQDEFNPNVSLEVGYMMGMGKSVCLLKDRNLRSLHTDLVGKLYESFDPQEPATSIPPVLERWLRGKDLVV